MLWSERKMEIKNMKNDMKFEDAIVKLEDAVRMLEGGGISLDEAISVYEEAVKLVKICHVKLENAKQKVKILTESEDGTVSDSPFVCDET